MGVQRGGVGALLSRDDFVCSLLKTVSSPFAKTPRHRLEEPSAPLDFSGKLSRNPRPSKHPAEATISCFQLYTVHLVSWSCSTTGRRPTSRFIDVRIREHSRLSVVPKHSSLYLVLFRMDSFARLLKSLYLGTNFNNERVGRQVLPARSSLYDTQGASLRGRPTPPVTLAQEVTVHQMIMRSGQRSMIEYSVLL